MEQPDGAKQHDDRDCGDKCGQQAIAERIIILRPSHRATLALFLVTFRSDRAASFASSAAVARLESM
jgi:hypothetical protein